MRQIKRRWPFHVVLSLGLAAVLREPVAAQATSVPPPRLRVPASCEAGRTCFVQYYMDRDPSPGARDFRCGTLSYDGHNGTDIRVPTLADQKRGVDVLAAADGQVLRVRDGVPDISVRVGGRERVQGAECGNAVVIAHAGGLETQYCHMAQRSVAVRPGETVADPFAPEEGGSCGAGRPLWDEAAARALAYAAGSVLNAGFSPGPVTMEAIESGDAGRGGVGAESPALVAFVRAIGLKAGDVQRLALTGPDGAVLADAKVPPLESDKAQWMMFGGVRRPAAGWRPGVYRARYALERDGKTELEHAFAVDLKP
jgi:hypothetical protein